MKQHVQLNDMGPLDLINLDRQRNDPRPDVTYDTPGVECPHADAGCCPSCMGAVRSTMHTPLPESVSKVSVAGERRQAWLAARKFFSRPAARRKHV